MFSSIRFYMKNLLLFFGIIFYTGSLLSENVLAAKPSDSDSALQVTYIANCGFLIENRANKILIDGLFIDGLGKYDAPDEATIDLMKTASSPFDDIDYIFVTHIHSDHFDAALILSHLKNNPSGKVICPQQVFDELQKNGKAFIDVESRIIKITPQPQKAITKKAGDLQFTACRISHEGFRNKHIENNGYLIDLGGYRIFHSGDGSVKKINKFHAIDLSKMNIDLAFLFEDFGITRFLDETKKYINADNYVFMHLPKGFSDEFFSPFEEDPTLINDPFIFQNMMEKKFY